ncbi:hypothetical protein NIES4071_41850 [Calothrix sp. NIES-4071]|nr:hypothetical protein NIES4071_41850 [Calothrix sp. NIES-4071]BAZ58501.1 hypothetical protein NIES4105_41790 [Calothrix sp. NIES-4105]
MLSAVNKFFYITCVLGRAPSLVVNGSRRRILNGNNRAISLPKHDDTFTLHFWNAPRARILPLPLLIERIHQEYQNFTENTEAEDRKYAPVTQNQPTIKSDCLFLNSPLYIHSPMEKFIYTEISQLGCALDIKAPKLQEKSSLLSKILNLAIHCGYKTINMDFQEADDAVCAKFNQFLYWVVLLELFVT